MSSGARDTLIIFERRSIIQDPDYGTPIESWAEHSRAWAEVQDVLPSRSESIDDSISIQRRPARVRIDYFDGVTVTAQMRIDVDGRKLQIIGGPAMKGKRKEWEMMTEELSTQGEAP